MEPYQIFLTVILIMSVITFMAYCIDKAKAKSGGWRTPEKVLLGLSFFGGAMGGFLAMYTVRHKTKHWYFAVINAFSIALHLIILVYLYNLT